jgi:hypothetical protein
MGELRNWVNTRTIWDEVGSFVFKAHGYTTSTSQEHIDFEELSSSTSEVCWQFIAEAADCRVMLTSGTLAIADSSLRCCSDPTLSKSQHFDLRVGTVGSGDGMAVRMSGVDAQTFYGPCYLGTVLFSGGQFKTYFDQYRRKGGMAQTRNRLSEPKLLVDVWRSNPNMTKSLVRAHFGSRFTHRRFDELWKEASVIEPKMADKGRRKAHKPLQETPTKSI